MIRSAARELHAMAKANQKPRDRRDQGTDCGLADYPAVYPREHFSLDAALNRFAKRCQRAGIVHEVTRHSHFLPKPQVRRNKQRRARKRRNAA
jgi:ribosomal protein S21